jgi:HK97 family phage major capsid protein
MLKLKRLDDGSVDAEGADAAAYVDTILTEEERRWDFRDGSEQPLTAQQRRQRLAALESQIHRPERANFVEYCRYGKEAIYEGRAQGLGSGAGGGYLAPQSFADQVFWMQKKIDALFDANAITVLETSRGTSEPLPLFDDTSSAAAVVSESGSFSIADVAFDQLLLAAASTWRTPMVKCSLEFVQDSAFDIETLLAKAFAAQLARGIGPSLVTTLAAAATQGVAGGSGITVDDIYNLFGAIDPAYFASSKCAWAMRLSTLVYISKLKDTAGQPVFPLRRNPNGDFELLTLPVRICPSVAAIGTGAKSVFFGDLSYLVMRRIQNSLSVKRIDELYATNAQAGFCSFLRVSSGFAKPSASDSPVKYLQHS